MLRKSVLRECLALIPTANLLGFNLWGWGVVTRKYTPLTTGTVPEQSWNSRGLLEPSWNLPGTVRNALQEFLSGNLAGTFPEAITKRADFV